MPLPTIRPASMTRIRSAFMIVPTRWATMITRRPADLALERGTEARVGPEVERREAVVEDVGSRPASTSARAIASRWRWPPETFVPPWVIGASSPPSISSTKSRRLGDLEGVPQLLVGRVLVAEAEVARDRAAEQERLLGDDARCAARGPSRSSSRTSTPSTRTAPSVAS